MRLDVLLVVMSVLQDLVYKSVEQSDVGAALYGEMHARLSGDGRRARVHHDEFRGIRSYETVEDPHPGHGLCLGHVVAEEHNGVGMVYIGVGAWLAVAAEGLLERLRGGRGAKAGVAVHVRGPDAGLPDHGQRVVLLQEELARRVEAEGERPLLLKQLLRATDDAVKGFVPIRFDQLAVLANQG